MVLARHIKKVTLSVILKQIAKSLANSSTDQIIAKIRLLEKIVRDENTKTNLEMIREAFETNNPLAVALQQIGKKELSNECRKKLINNLIINAVIIGAQHRSKIESEEGFRPPFFFVISPTMRCNLNCVGCYAGEYTKEDDLPFEVIDRVLKEAKELGIYFITISGGEPFIRKDLLGLFEKHNDMYFLVYTNGQLIDEALAKRLAKLGNVAPGISVEGFEIETDKRRGKGVYNKVLKAMDYLKKYGVVFGFSATPTRFNSEILCKDEFIDFYINKGCLFGWFFQYIPIGKAPQPELMSTPEQRNKLREKIREWRIKKKPIFIGDFWNDGPLVGGCIAGARRYFHINCKGDVEPCVFIHFAVDNIKEKSLKEVINSDFFKTMRKVQPYRENKNLFTPCAIIDNPHILRNLVKRFNAKPTHPGAETIVDDEKIVKFLDEYSEKWKAIVDPIWEKEYMYNPCSKWYYKGKMYLNLGAK